MAILLTREQVEEIQRDPRAVNWKGEKLKVDGDYGPQTQWWHGISVLHPQRVDIVCEMVSYHGKGEDSGTPNRAKWLDKIQEPANLTPRYGNPWCVLLQSAILTKCKVKNWPYFASAYELIRWARQHGLVTENPIPGDIYAFLYNPDAIGFTPGHCGGYLGGSPDWAIGLEGNVGNTTKTGKRARKGLIFIKTVEENTPPLIMPPLAGLPNLDGTLRGTR